MSKSKKLRVGLIGAGGIALDQHLPAWFDARSVKVVAAADPSPVARDAAAAKFAIERIVDDYRELLDDRSIDVVDICAPSALHAEITVDALGRGKHVLCEKPMATSAAGAGAILDAWRKSGRKLMIGHHLRFDPSIVRLREALAARPLGRIYYARAQWLRRRRLPGKPGFTDKRLSGGGVMYDLGVHLLDLAWWLMDCPRPTTVSGATSNLLSRRGDLGTEWGSWDPATIDVEDFAAGQVRFDNGSLLSLEMSWLALQRENEFWRLQLFGDQAGADWPAGVVSGEADGQPWDVVLPPPNGPKGHRAAIHHFIDCVSGKAEVIVKPEQSAEVIAMLEALYKSAASGHEAPIEQLMLNDDRSSTA